MTQTHVLLVCNANMCRSPMAEWILRARLDEQRIQATVSSAGVLFVGRPATDKAIEVVADRGGDIRDHRSRIIDGDMLRSVDLVLTMERNLVRKIWEISPDLLDRSFTLKGFNRLALEAGPRAPGEELDAWLARVGECRDIGELAARSDVDDVKDPIGQNARRYRSVADELDRLLSEFIDLTWPQRTATGGPTSARLAPGWHEEPPVTTVERRPTPHVTPTQSKELTVIEVDDGGLNALTPEICDGIHLALDEAQRSSQVAVIAGRTGVFATTSDEPDDEAAVADLLLRLHGYALPVIAACTGTARGHGAALLLACDLRVGVDSDEPIGFDLLERGRAMDTVSIELARDRLGRQYVVPSVLLGTPWTPDQALSAGFLDHLVPADELVTEVASHAHSLASRLSSGPFAVTRRRMRTPLISYLEDTVRAER